MYALEKAKEEMVDYLSKILEVDKSKILNSIEYPKSEIADISLPLPSVTKKRDLDIQYSGYLIKEMARDKIFINARLNETTLMKEIFSNFDVNYGIIKTEKPLKIVVEHTSANPIHPLHVGHLRNAIIGDTLVRLLKARGHVVNSRFYVNDGGRQVALLIYGLSKLGYPDPPEGEKKDSWLGLIYAITNVILEIRKVTEELKTASDQEYKEKISKRDELVGIASDLQSKNQEYFDKIVNGVNNDKDPEAEISRIIQLYENGDNKIKQIVRKYVNYALEGFKESLEKLHIHFDNFDYESDLLWSGSVRKILDLSLESIARISYKGTVALDLQKFIDDQAREELKIPKGFELPPLVLMRSDGTSLYTVRDIAYTLYKFSQFNADEVINVIAEQQSVPQIQLRAALYILGYPEVAKKLIHYSYGMVTVQGIKMSGRLGRYISFDTIYEKVSDVVKAKVQEKNGIMENAGEITNAAIRYAIVSVSANKPVSFNISRVANFEENSGPYLQYTYARAYNILNKASDKLDVEKIDPNDIKNEKRQILIMIAKFPEVFMNSADYLQPENLVAFLRTLADTFNSWYDKERVIQEQDEKKRITRLLIVKGVEAVLRNGLNVLGINSLTRM
ncbi:arginine--tRNA ligase [Acidianus sulfidivorans JP7]|uniref:Arginine--tRNA ligase n=1 Tax=Acidianus sulfidivorans JP7 TaxID=619593 RepID=A0A2U9IP18_9CREN|nr:arginine--tRNA ligase [Acidianus sulfidivorans]AWR97788.1 arginine--tRNA ligase [Acidianus sulfidivorans JP7]